MFLCGESGIVLKDDEMLILFLGRPHLKAAQHVPKRTMLSTAQLQHIRVQQEGFDPVSTCLDWITKCIVCRSAKILSQRKLGACHL